MNQIFIFIFGLVVGAVAVWLIARSRQGNGSPATPNLIQKQAQEKAEYLGKIKEFIKDKETVVNNDIQKLLGVSDATVTRYLDELEKEGVLRQKGEKKGVYYEKIG